MINQYYIANNECVICGEKSYNKVLCPNCYKKFKKYKDRNENLKYCDKNIEYALIKLLAYFDILEENNIYKDKGGFLIDFAQYIRDLIKENIELEINLQRNKNKCLICDCDTDNNYKFCSSCYNKYKNKDLILKITNCSKIDILSNEYQSNVRCDDGHKVKSSFEKIIDNYFYNHDIKHAYEKEIDITKDLNLTPDFFLPEYKGKKNIYIEFWGIGKEDKNYTKIKEYKTKIYNEIVKTNKNLIIVYLYSNDVLSDKWLNIIKYANSGVINNLQD